MDFLPVLLIGSKNCNVVVSVLFLYIIFLNHLPFDLCKIKMKMTSIDEKYACSWLGWLTGSWHLNRNELMAWDVKRKVMMAHDVRME